MKTPFRPYIFSNDWYKSPSTTTDRVTTKQWQEILLNHRDEFNACGKLQKVVATKIGPGVYEIRTMKPHTIPAPG